MEVPGERYAASVGVGRVADNDAHLSDEGLKSGVLRAFRARRVYLWLSKAQAELAEQVSPVIVENNSRLAGTAASCVEQTQRVDGNVRSSAVCGWSVSRDCRTRPVVSDQTSTVGDKASRSWPGAPWLSRLGRPWVALSALLPPARMAKAEQCHVRRPEPHVVAGCHRGFCAGRHPAEEWPG